MAKTGDEYYENKPKIILTWSPKVIKRIQNFGEEIPPKVDVRVGGRGSGHPFEAEATRFFGGGARVRSRDDRRRIRGPAAWRRGRTNTRGGILVSSWFGEERA